MQQNLINSPLKIKNALRILIALVLCINFLWSNAQLLDTSDVHIYKPIDVSIINETDYLFMRSDSAEIDTSLNNFQSNYKAYSDHFPFIDLGLEGSHILSLSNGNERAFGFGLGPKNLSYYFFSDTIHVYQTARPFTRLSYSQGNNELINISATHAQQLSKRLAFGIDYHRLKNQNFYYSNIANGDRIRMNNWFNTKLYTNYCSKDRRYELLVSYLWNKSINVESGGIQSDSFFNALSGRSKFENNKAYFSEAFGEQAQNQFTVIQYFRPQKSILDSTQIYKLDRFTNQFYLKSKADFNRISYTDESPDSASYNIGLKLDPFKDSILLKTYSNELGYSVKLLKLNVSVGIIHSYNTIIMNEVSENYNNVYLTSLGNLKVKQFEINADANFGILGYNLGDYKIRGEASTTWKKFNVRVGILSQLIEPFYTEQNLASNVISWNNSFKKTSVNQLFASASLQIKNQWLKLKLLSETNNNLIYFDTDLLAKQNNDFISLLKFETTYGLKTNHFGTIANVVFQQVSNATVLPRPAVAGNLDVFTNFRLFASKLNMQVGTKAYWFSKFDSPKYNPYTRQWHLTNESYTMYPPLSVYANAQLKSFCFGIEFFHAQMQLMGTDYYASPGYPLMPRVMRLNFRWDLSN